MKQCWPAPERNKTPIFEVLQRVLPERGTLLEVASGSGQHAAFFAQHLPGWTWLPSDIDPDNLASIRAHRAAAGCDGFREPRALDVTDADWDVPPLDAGFSANMIHIAPFDACLGLLRGMGRYLKPSGKLVLYGPFRIAGQHTAPSNATFDADLRARDPRWGVRDLETVVKHALENGFRLVERVEMPANNLCVVFERE
jgi:SAM-dependent methyltransferase